MTTVQTPDLPSSSSDRATATWRPLLRHYVEMVVAMAAGMLLLGGARMALGLAPSSADRPGAAYTLMAVDMSLGMAAWMRFRGHGWSSTLEMCAAMFVPLALLPLVWAGAIGAATYLTVAHAVMLVAMLAVLLRRRDEMVGHCR
mgnify:CR=1 FL=1